MSAYHFSRKLGTKISNTTVSSIRKSYLEMQSSRSRDDDDDELTSFPHKKQGRYLLLGETIDKYVQDYVAKLRDGGGVVNARIVASAAKGIVLGCDQSMLVEFGGYVELNYSWAYSLLNRMNFVQRKATTAKSKLTSESFAKLKQQFL